MNAPLTALGSSGTLDATMRGIGRQAREAARALALAPASRKNRALARMAASIRAARSAILAANAEDLAEAKSAGATAAFVDRLTLDAQRIEAMAAGLEVIRKLKDPVGIILASWRRPNGMRIERVRVPLGVVGVIYESRPNVTADAAALCLKAGNAVILRGGSESSLDRAIHAALVEGLVEADLPAAAISLVPTRERAAVGMMLAGLEGTIDVIVPRGGKSLVGRVQADARVPVFAHSRGRLPCLCRRRGQAQDGKGNRAQCQNAPHRRVRSGRNLAGRSGGSCEAAQAARRHADRRRLRDPRRCGGAGGRPPRKAGQRGRLEHGISRCDFDRGRGRRRRWSNRPHRTLWLASHRRDRDRKPCGGGEIPARG